MQHTAAYHRILLQQIKGSYSVVSIQFPSFPFNFWCFEASSFKQSFNDNVCGKTKILCQYSTRHMDTHKLARLSEKPIWFSKILLHSAGQSKESWTAFLALSYPVLLDVLENYVSRLNQKATAWSTKASRQHEASIQPATTFDMFSVVFLHVLHFWIFWFSLALWFPHVSSVPDLTLPHPRRKGRLFSFPWPV